MTTRLLTLTVLFCISLAGCQTPSSNSRTAEIGDGDPYELLRAAAARDGTAAAPLRLRAAALFLEADDARSAIDTLDLLDPSTLPVTSSAASRQDPAARSLHDQYYSLRARALRQLEAWEEAAAALRAISVRTTEDQLQLAELCTAVQQHHCAATAWIAAWLESGGDPEQLPPDIIDRTWLSLSAARQAPPAFTHRYELAWWQLQAQARAAATVPARLTVWRRWRAANPSHPAALNPPAALAALENYQSPRLALLLPLSGPFAMAGNAARDGFIAAALSEPVNERSLIQIYDSHAYDLDSLWDTALADGADVIVGPLLKAQAEKFAALTREGATPRLLLNYTPSADPDRALFQFGIAIEDEAESLLRHVADRGHEKLLVVASNAAWSSRASQLVQNNWPHSVAAANFTDIKRLTEAVGESMQVADSQERHSEISRILGTTTEFLPRARGDLDAVIALTNQMESQALVPALRFHFADQLPVFATSQVARGDDETSLRHFQRTEMPLLSDPAFAALNDALALRDHNFTELYALGFDAYRVAGWLPIVIQGDAPTLPGASGNLWFGQGGRVHRELALAPQVE